MLVPLVKLNQFGFLLVLSSRISATEAELDFLNIFAQQIELAITIADLFQMVREQAVTDALTTLYNRRYFEEAITKICMHSDEYFTNYYNNNNYSNHTIVKQH